MAGKAIWYERGRLWAKTPYDPHLVEAFKRAGGRWHKEERLWSFPLASLALIPQDPFPREGFHRLYRLLGGRAKEAWGRARVWRESGLLLPEQAEDLRQAFRALLRRLFRGGPKGFLLAAGTGTGKTYVYSAFASLARELGFRPLIVLPNEDLTRQVEEVLALFGVGDLPRTTYAKLDPKEVEGETLLILDEAHMAKRLGSGGANRAERSLFSAFRAGFILFATATPFDKPWEAAYLLHPTRLYRHLGYRDLDSFLKGFAVHTRAGFGGGKEYYFTGDVADLKRFHATLVGSGFMRKRLFTPTEPVTYEVPILKVAREERELLAEVRRRLKEASWSAPPEERGLVEAHRTLLSRAMLERMKLRSAIPLVGELLEEGWHVVLFLQYRGEKELDLTTEEGFQALWDEAEERGGKVLHHYLLPALKGLHLRFPSPLSLLEEAFAPLGEALGFYTGRESQARLKRTKERWDRGEVRLLVATAAKGGTGLSLHDTTGRRPTAQVVMTLPWTATQLDQVLGRTVRVGMRSPVRILLPATTVPFERRLASTIAASLYTLGYAVRGGVEVVPQEVIDAFLYDLAAVSPSAFGQKLALIKEEAASLKR